MSPTPSSTLALSVSGSKLHRSKRLRSFALPDGREVHIALSPEEAQNLRLRLEGIRRDEPFDLVIHGSSEHIEALKKAHTHQEQRRETLREQHAPLYDEFERVREELDALSADLHMLTDHAVSLDANFSKYGYSAHLRTYDDPPESSSSSMYDHDENEHEVKDWEAERHNGRIFKLYKHPKIKQYFHRGLLWRASRSTEVATFELFFDLLFVGIISINGDHSVEDPTGKELLRFLITFIMSWRIWSDLSVIVGWVETDDIIQRLAVLLNMACLVGLTTNMLEAFEGTYTQLVAFYLAARLSAACYYVVLAFAIPMVKGMMITQALAIFVPALLWIGSIYVAMPNRLALIWIALFLDLFGSLFGIFLIRGSKTISDRLAKWVEHFYEFYPAVNIEHKTERTNAFVTLIFGYSVVALLYQNKASFGVNAFFGKAVLGLIQAFAFNMLYFEVDNTNLFTHAIRRSVVSSLAWVSSHLPFLLGYSLAAASLSKLVVAHDCPDTNLEDLTELYMSKSGENVELGLRWFYCGGFGVALFFMGIISLCHIHKDVSGVRITKGHRLANRFAVCIVLFCLPLVHQLNSLYLIAISTSLVSWVLILELYGASCPDETFFGKSETCKYTARCKLRKKDMETALKTGEVINVQDLSNGGERGLYDLS